MFKRLENDEALIVERGIYKPAEVYEGPEGALFVKAKGGFVRVKMHGDTTHSSVRVERLLREGPLYRDDFGRLCVTGGGKRREMLLNTQQGEGRPLLAKKDT